MTIRQEVQADDRVVGSRSFSLVALRHEQGSSLIELALVLPVLLLMLVGSIDFGRAFYAAIEVSSAAHAGACYGLQQPSDTSGMQAAAVLDAPDVTNLKASAISGCECSDGTSASTNCATTPSCSVNIVSFVQVTTTATYTPILNYPGLPTTINLQGITRLRAAH